jgi:hypothetical protein
MNVSRSWMGHEDMSLRRKSRTAGSERIRSCSQLVSNQGIPLSGLEGSPISRLLRSAPKSERPLDFGF